MAPRLMNIPPEVQDLIGGHLHISDLSRVSQTCKTFNNAFLAKLYSLVIIRVPIRWSRLKSLEDLISSAGSGLKFTTRICIIAQQQLSKDHALEFEDSRTAQEIADEKDLFFCLPQISASKALNVLIRLLLIRIPNNHLNLFDCSHSCALEVDTLALLLMHQSATLRGLGLSRYSEPQNVSSLLIEGLQHLVITDLNIQRKCEWPSRLISQNRNTLRHLKIGVMNTVVRDYAIHNFLSHHELPSSFAECAKEELPVSERETMPTLSLETLSLYGLNLENVVGGALGLDIDFNSMTGLRFESCSGLTQAFALLMGNGGAQKTKLGSLKSFILRHEDGSQAFAQHLIAFLICLPGLSHLSILLDRCSKAIRTEQILGVHGKTLQTLIWEQRTGPRADTKSNTSVFRNSNLKYISLNCPNLKALGLAIDWPSINRSYVGVYATIKSIFGRMKTLRTFHIRNLPEIDFNETYLPIVYAVQSLAKLIADILASGKKSDHLPLLDTIALGAPVYRDIHVGSNHFPSESVRNFLQLRVYHVDYGYQSVLGPSPTVTEVAKGTADDATTCIDKGILHEYWLA